LKTKIITSVTLIAILFSAIALALPLSLLGVSADTEPPTLTVTKTVDPKIIKVAGSPTPPGVPDTTTITITVTGYGGTEEEALPMDIVFSIDSSGSMGWNDPGNLRLAAAKSFVDKLDSTTDQTGVVSWDTDIDFTYPDPPGMTNDFTTAKSKIDTVDSSGGTNLNVGLFKAIDMLDGNTRTDPSAEAIIFLTDGQGAYTWSGNPGSPADDAASKGYVIYSIGLGSPSTGPLIDMASATGGAYYSSPTPANLQAIFDAIYQQVLISTAPSWVDVVEVTQDYIIDEGSFSIAPDSVVEDTTTEITWLNVAQYVGNNDEYLTAEETFEVSFTARSSEASCWTVDGWAPVDVYGEAVVNYTEPVDMTRVSVDIPQAYIFVYPMPTVVELTAGGGNPKSAMDVGSVIVWNDEGILYVIFKTMDGWTMNETHLHVATGLGDIPQKNGNPVPGMFMMKHEDLSDVCMDPYRIPLEWGHCTNLYIAAHAVVQKCDMVETAWGGPYPDWGFEGRNWAIYFMFHVCHPGEDP
jgi:Ca-activated chloride channel family protein